MELLRLRASAFPRGGPTRGRARGKYLASDICLAGLSCRRKRVRLARKDLHLGLCEGPAAAARGRLDWTKQWAQPGNDHGHNAVFTILVDF